MLPRTLLTCFLLFPYVLGSEKLPIASEQNVIRDFLINQNILRCCVIKQQGTESSLEDSVALLYQQPRFKKNIAGVVHIPDRVANASQDAFRAAETSSMLRCFISPGFGAEISGPQSAAQISKWLILLKKKMKHMWQDDVDQLEILRSRKDVVILILPSLAQLSHVDETARIVMESLSRSFSVAVVLIHPESRHASPIRAHLSLPVQTSLVVVLNSLKEKTKPVVYKGKDITAKRISVESFAQLSGIKHLTVANFEWEATTVKRTERFRPYIIVFYTWWAAFAEEYLRLIKVTVDEMQDLGIMARFALVNVAEEKTVLSRYVDVKHFKALPFVAVFQRDKGKDTVNQTLLSESHPSPFFFYQALRAHGVWLSNVHGELWDYSPYLTLDFTHYSDLREGPRGVICTAWASNLTDSLLPPTRKSQKKKANKRLPPRLEKQMPNVDDVPILTEAFWDAVVERSRIISGSLQLEPNVHITMLAFIQAGCGSCNQKMGVFKNVYLELLKKENTRLYMVNCTNDPDLCKDLRVHGFPSVSAFRSFAAFATTKCAVNPLEKPYIRRDYHGPISTDNLILWMESLALSGLTNAGFVEISQPSDMVEDVRLVATVTPKFSNYLPLAPGGERDYFYSQRCLRLACEQLFGLASCYVTYSREIPPGDFSKAQARGSGMVVTKIRFERRDGVSVSLMRLGKSMLRLLEEETSSDLHLFHRPHQYSLHPKQTCEEDHDACTQTITSFVLDHLRLPVTQLSSEIFHTRNNPLFDEDRPVLIALAHAENITQTSGFMQLLGSVARKLYHEITVTILDADQFPAWAGSFVPQLYSTLYVDAADGGPLHVYPRVCLVTWHNHKQAAFYPPLHNVFNTSVLSQLKIPQAGNVTFTETAGLSASKEDGAASGPVWNEEDLVAYVKAYLKNPFQHLVRTEHF